MDAASDQQPAPGVISNGVTHSDGDQLVYAAVRKLDRRSVHRLSTSVSTPATSTDAGSTEDDACSQTLNNEVDVDGATAASDNADERRPDDGLNSHSDSDDQKPSVSAISFD